MECLRHSLDFGAPLLGKVFLDVTYTGGVQVHLNMKRSPEYPPTVAGVKRGLKAVNYSQRRAALETDQSPSLVSMVLNRQMKSQPCLNRLHALITSKLEECVA